MRRRILNRNILMWVLVTAGLLWTADTYFAHREPDLLATYLVVDSIRLRAVVSGDEPPTIVLLHGYSESLFAWRQVYDQLRTEFRTVVFDLPGFGVSGKPDSGYTVERIAGIVGTAIARLAQGRPLIVVGHSMGGVIAGWLAVAEPQLVDALVLVDAAGLSGPVLSRLEDLSPSAVSRVFGVGAALRAPHDPRWLAEPDSILDYQPSADERYYRALEAVLRDFDFTALDSLLPQITQPTLIVWGRHDNTTPLENGIRFASEIHNARLVVLDGAVHRPHFTHPDEVAAAISEFVTSDLGWR